jgi:hypothetical protein
MRLLREKISNEELLERIKTFLSVKIENDGGRAPVFEDDWVRLHGIFEKLIAAKWEEDQDGDLSVEYDIVNRNIHERMHFVPIPYAHYKNSVTEIDAILERALLNLSIAMSTVDELIKYKRFATEREKDAK